MMTANRPAKLPLIPPASTRSSPPPAHMVRRPASANSGTFLLRRASMIERESTARGGALVASRAGGTAAARVAPMPSRTPLARVWGSSGTLRTSRTK